MDYEFLIVGKGITGSILANNLAKITHKFKIINYENVNSSSRVAAGIMHPMALKRGTLSWRGKEFFEFSEKYYENFDRFHGTKFYKKHHLFRIFSSFEEQNNWTGKSSDNIYSSLISVNKNSIKNINHPYGSGVVNNAGRLSIVEFLDFLSTKYSQNISNNNFQFKNLQIKNKLFLYEGDRFKKVFMCQGVNATQNPMFNYLPIIPNKGELINVKSKDLPNIILNCGVFSLPINDCKFTIGSTYNHRDDLEKNTKEAKEELLEKIGKVINLNNVDFLSQKYGFRPTTSDRKPLIGEHPIIKNLYIINGMGSKAVLMAPLLISELLKNKVDKSTDIKRFQKKIKPSNINYANSLIH